MGLQHMQFISYYNDLLQKYVAEVERGVYYHHRIKNRTIEASNMNHYGERNKIATDMFLLSRIRSMTVGTYYQSDFGLLPFLHFTCVLFEQIVVDLFRNGLQKKRFISITYVS